MITPLFECQQDEKKVVLLVRAPHSRPRDIDVSVVDKELHFHCSPYLLHLRFPHGLSLDPEESPASYSIETGIATIPLLKNIPGQYFERLDMLSALMVSRKRPGTSLENAPATGPSIEVLDSENALPVTEVQQNDSSAASGRSLDQNSLQPALSAETVLLSDASQKFREGDSDVAGIDVSMNQLSVGRPKYGFGARYEGILEVRAEDLSDVIELPSPDSTPVWRRPQIRHELENTKFDSEHYVADFMLAEEFQHVFEFSPDRNIEESKLSNHAKDVLLKLPKREYLQDIDDRACADLAGLIFASCYDIRTTCGERNVESAWTVSRLCASFSCLEVMTSPYISVCAAYRRSLAYPLYRHRGLSDMVLEDTKQLMNTNGNMDHLRSRLLRVLLSLQRAFEENRLLRIFCDLFLTDFCIWIQHVDDSKLRKLAADVDAIHIDKSALSWDLWGLERRAINASKGIPEVDEAEGETSSEAPALMGSERQSAHIFIRSTIDDGLGGGSVTSSYVGITGDNNAEDVSSSSSSSTSSSNCETDSSSGEDSSPPEPRTTTVPLIVSQAPLIVDLSNDEPE